MFPGVFLVKLHDGSVLKVRYDHMMLAERIEKSKHYRELYEHRLAADKYEYPASNVQGNNA